MSDDCSGNPYDIRTDQHRSTHCAEMVSEDYRFFNRLLYRKRKEEVK